MKKDTRNKLILILIAALLVYIVSDSIYGFYKCEHDNDIWFTGKSSGARMIHSDVNLRTVKSYMLGYCVERINK